MRYFNLIKTITNWPRYLRYKLFGGSGPLTFVTRAGITIEVPERVMHDFKAVFFQECYLEEMPRPLLAGTDIVDVGANVGAFTFFAATRFPGHRILAFEPDPANFAQLERNAALNPGRAQVHRMAVAGATGEATLVGGEPDAHTTGASIVAAVRPGTGMTVPAISLADLFTTFGVARCGLLKLDCEGAEFPILHAAPDWALQRVDQMIMEVHPTSAHGPSSRAGLSAYLNGRGFRTRDTRFGLLRAWR
jgi:FkbM family methyltransferase